MRSVLFEMTTIRVRLPNSVHDRLRQLASREGVSMNQLVATAVAEKVSAIEAGEYLAERAARGDRAAFEAALGRVPDVNPEPGDELAD